MTLVAWCACPSPEAADALAKALVESRAAACATALGPARSTYRWKGEIEHGAETLLMIKTTEARWPEVEAIVQELHPYDVPELIASPISHGSAAYLAWLDEETQ